MIMSPYAKDLVICKAYMDMFIVRKDVAAIERNTPHMKNLIWQVFNEGYECLAADSQEVLQRAEMLTLTRMPPIESTFVREPVLQKGA